MNLAITSELIKYAVDNSLITANLETGDILRGAKVLSQSPHHKGYLRIGFLDPRCGITRKLYVHRIIAYVVFGDNLFLDNCSVDHVNGVITDNRASNIRVLPRVENTVRAASMTKGWHWVVVDHEVVATCKYESHAKAIAIQEKGVVVFSHKCQ